MSALDGQLRAQGGPCEHLAKLFAYKRGMNESGFPCPPLSETPWADALNQLLARIDELEADLAAEAKDADEAVDSVVAKVKWYHGELTELEHRVERAEDERDQVYQACADAGWEVESGNPETFVAELAAQKALLPVVPTVRGGKP